MLFPFFLMIDLSFLILAVITQIFVPTAELVMPTGTLTNEANAGNEEHPLEAEKKIRKCSK